MKHIKEFKVFESSEPEVKREYYLDGKVQKEKWFLNGKMHKEDGPAEIGYYPDSKVQWEGWFIDDEAHREDGPAWINYYSDGKVQKEKWFLNGNLHREDGPASIWYYPNGSVEWERWFLNGKELSKAQWVELTPGLSAEELIKISTKDQDSVVRKAARKNPNFPKDLESWAINLDDWT